MHIVWVALPADRLIVEFSKENAPFLNSLRYCDKRHLNNIVESFQISDHTASVFHFFNKQYEQLDQILWTNCRYIVERKQILFNSLWKMATPVPFEKMSWGNYWKLPNLMLMKYMPLLLSDWNLTILTESNFLL